MAIKIAVLVMSITAPFVNVCVAQDSQAEKCNLAIENSRAEWTTFHNRRGLFLSAAPRLFTRECDNNGFDKAHATAFFQHDRVLNAADTRTDIFLQISIENLGVAVLRFTIAGVVLVVNSTHTRTHTHRQMSGFSSAANYERFQTYLNTGKSLEAQQLQELRITITKTSSECALSLQIGPPAPHGSIVRQRWQCGATDIFALHGNYVSLHSVVLQVDKRRQAIWDFSQQIAASGALCSACPSGKTMDAETKQCNDCYTGFRVNVDNASKWWSNAATSPSTTTVPEPDWAVVKVHGKAQSKGIMRHSSITNNGNMILTPDATVYSYEKNHVLPHVCEDKFDSRVRKHALLEDRRTLGLLFRAGLSRILISWQPVGLVLTVRGYLSVAGLTWSLADTVTFCEHGASDLVVLHTCMNPIVFTYVRVSTWHPLNINPIHHKYTQYTLSLRNEIFFSSPYN